MQLRETAVYFEKAAKVFSARRPPGSERVGFVWSEDPDVFGEKLWPGYAEYMCVTSHAIQIVALLQTSSNVADVTGIGLH